MSSPTLHRRAYVEMGQYRMVLDDVGPNAPTTLQAAKALAAYHAGGREDKDMAVESLKEWLASSQDQQLLLIAALVFSPEGDYKEALKWVHQSTDLETMAVVAHIYLSMNRVELARKQVGLMQQQDDDATLTKLSGAWVSNGRGRRQVPGRALRVPGARREVQHVVDAHERHGARQHAHGEIRRGGAAAAGGVG